MLLRLIWDTVKKIYFQCLINYMYNQHFYFYFPPVDGIVTKLDAKYEIAFSVKDTWDDVLEFSPQMASSKGIIMLPNFWNNL